MKTNILNRSFVSPRKRCTVNCLEVVVEKNVLMYLRLMLEMKMAKKSTNDSSSPANKYHSDVKEIGVEEEPDALVDENRYSATKLVVWPESKQVIQ